MTTDKKLPTTQDPAKYYRTGIAITLERKAIFEERLAALGLATVGDLVTMFILADGIVELLKPTAEKFKADTETRKTNVKTKHGALQALKRMSPEELTALMELAKQSQVK